MRSPASRSAPTTAATGPTPSSGPSTGRYAWRAFRTGWDAEPGDHVLLARATDDTGQVQPTGPAWSRGGFANNGSEPVRVRVVASG